MALSDDTNYPPRAALNPPRPSPRRSSWRYSVSPERPSRYHDSTEQISSQDLQYPPGFDLNGFEDIVFPPPSALTSRTTVSLPHPQLDSDEDDDDGNTVLSSNNTFLERCKTTALNIPTTSVTLTQNPRASIQARAKSIANLVPTWNNRQDSEPEDTISPTESKPKRNTTFGDLFIGSSAPINIGITPSPDKEKASMDWGNNNSTTRPTHKRTSTGLSGASTSKFSWFGTKTFNPAPTPIPEGRPQSSSSDPLLDLSADTSLFPHGPVDRFDPASFNDLLRNAQTTIAKLQTGYRQKCGEVETVRAESSAQNDEAEEAETRARHLKLQLDDMAARAAEQDQAMKALADQLAQERLIRREEEEARKRSVMLVRTKSQQFEALEREGSGCYSSSTSKRESRGASDSGFESDADADSTVESVFSRPANELGSPLTMTPLSTLNEWESDDVDQIHAEHINRARPAMTARRTSTGQRITGLGLSGKRKSGVSLEDYMERRLNSPSTSSCANCHGGSQTNAWTLVSELRAENKSLNGRVAELERTVEGCLDLVAGLT